MKDSSVSAKVSSEVRETLENMAEEQNRTLSYIVSKILEKELNA